MGPVRRKGPKAIAENLALFGCPCWGPFGGFLDILKTRRHRECYNLTIAGARGGPAGRQNRRDPKTPVLCLVRRLERKNYTTNGVWGLGFLHRKPAADVKRGCGF